MPRLVLEEAGGKAQGILLLSPPTSVGGKESAGQSQSGILEDRVSHRTAEGFQSEI